MRGTRSAVCLALWCFICFITTFGLSSAGYLFESFAFIICTAVWGRNIVEFLYYFPDKPPV